MALKRKNKRAQLLLGAGVAASLAGCSTMSSKHLVAGTSPKIEKGLTYFMPKQLVRVSVVKTDLDIAKQADQLATKQAELAAAKKALEPLSALSKKIAAQIQALPEGSAARPAMQVELAKAVGEENVFKQTVSDLTKEVDDKRAIMIAARDPAKRQLVVTLELQAPIADPNRRFVLAQHHNPFRDDEQKFVRTASGLLTSADIVATDRTGDILLEIAAFAGGIPRMELFEQSDSCPLKINRVFDPTNGVQERSLNEELKKCNLSIEIEKDQIAASALTFTDSTQSGQVAGIAYSTGNNVTIHIKHEGATVESKSVLLPQAGPVSWLPTNASAFVKTTYGMKFQDGMLTNWDSNRPSELLEVARTPLRMLKGALGAVSEVIQLRVNVANDEKAYSEADLQALEKADELRIMRECVNKAIAADEDTAKCFD
jgi:hypothetical protein